MLEYQGVLLKPISKEESEQYRKLRNRNENRVWFKFKEEITTQQQLLWFEKYQNKKEDLMFAIYHADMPTSFLGAISVYDINDPLKQAEIGRIIVDKQLVKNKGIGSKAIQCLCQYSFKELGLKRIYAEIYSNNLASLGAFKKAGFIKKNTYLDDQGEELCVVELFEEEGEE